MFCLFLSMSIDMGIVYNVLMTADGNQGSVVNTFKKEH